MLINFSPLSFMFSRKPLLIGGKAMEYYGLRQAGDDIDLVVVKEDLQQLITQYPHQVKDKWGDLGVAVHGFEIWKTIDHFDYDFLSQGAIDEGQYLVLSLEKMVLQRAMAMEVPKYQRDLELIIQKIKDQQYSDMPAMQQQNKLLLADIPDLQYLEQSGPKQA